MANGALTTRPLQLDPSAVSGQTFTGSQAVGQVPGESMSFGVPPSLAPAPDRFGLMREQVAFAPQMQLIAPPSQPQQPMAPPPPAMRPQAAVRAAQAREVGLPRELQPQFGTYFPADYEQRVEASALTPEQKQRALGLYRESQQTGLGIATEGMRIPLRGAQELGSIEQERLAMRADLGERELKAQEEAAARIEQDEAIFQQQKQEMEAELVSRRKEMDGLRTEIAATKIDPQNYFASQPTWSKVLSLISVGIGGFASGWSGGRLQNTALQQLNEAIDRDIEAQKANLATKRGALAESQSLYGMARQKLGDDQKAFLFAKSRQLEKASEAASRLEAEGRTQDVRLRAREVAGKLREMSAATENQIMALSYNDFVRRQEEARRQAAAASPAAMQERERKARIARMKEELGLRKMQAETAKLEMEAGGGVGMGKQPEERIVQLGQRGEEQFLAPTTKAADELATRQAAATDFANTVDKMLSAARTGYLPGGVTATSRDINALHETAASQLARSNAGGRTTEQDEQRAKSILPKPAAQPWLDTGEVRALQTLKGTAQGNVEAYRQSVGAKRVQVETIDTPYGPRQRIVLAEDQPMPVTFKPVK